jgi:hypothetical protein
MTEISRRDFLNGFALTIAAGLTPAAQIAAQPLRYPPALTGMRGHHPGSFEVGHALRDGATFAFDQAPIEESYDLVVVGGGISGLAAAWFYRRAVGGDARILILDNHDDFGGHAKRNEFRLDGRLILGYGGSESMQSPQALYSKIAKLVLTELGVDIARFESAFERDLYPSLNLSRGVFFPREAFGRDTLVTGDPTVMVSDDIAPDRRNGKPVREFIAQFPVSAASKAQLIALYEGTTDPLPGKARTRSSSSSSRRAIATISLRSADAARRWPIVSRAARTTSSRWAATRSLPPTRARLAIPVSMGSAFRKAPIPISTSRISITSPTAMPHSRGSWCARSFRPWRRAVRWMMWCWRHSTIPSSMSTLARCVSGSIVPA